MTIQLKTTIILLVSVLASCTTTREKLNSDIYALETSDSSSTPEGMNNLATLYFDYSKNFTKDSIAEAYLFKGFMFKYILGKWDDALKFANFYKKSYPVTENTHNINLKLADLYYKGKNNLDSAVNYYLIAKGKARFSTDDYRNASFVLQKWATLNNKSDKRPEIIYNAAIFSQTASENGVAVKLYAQVANEYPAYQKAPDALSAAGFICWNDLKKPEEGKIYYKQLIEKYPDHPLTKDAKIILNENILGMSDLELSEYLAKKNKGI